MSHWIPALLILILAGPAVAETVTLEPVTLTGKTKDRDFAVLHEIGTAYYVQDKMDQSLENLEEALAIKPDDVELLYEIGSIHAQEGDPAKGLPYLQKAYRLAPDHYGVNMALGTIFHGKGNLKAAISYLKTAIKTEPGRSAPYIALGVIHQQLSEYKKALMYFTKGRELFPDHPVINLEIARTYQMGLDDPKSALSYALWATQLNPDDGDAHLTLGSIYFQLDDETAARPELQKAVSLFQQAGNTPGTQAAQDLLDRLR